MNDLSLHILDIVQNSISAGASVIGLGVDEDTAADTLTITITDNGRGMTPVQVAKPSDPCLPTRTPRKACMGLPLFPPSPHQSGASRTAEAAPWPAEG